MSFLKSNRTACFLLVLSVIFIIYGVITGEVQTVLRKAINICMECIGIG